MALRESFSSSHHSRCGTRACLPSAYGASTSCLSTLSAAERAPSPCLALPSHGPLVIVAGVCWCSSWILAPPGKTKVTTRLTRVINQNPKRITIETFPALQSEILERTENMPKPYQVFVFGLSNSRNSKRAEPSTTTCPRTLTGPAPSEGASSVSAANLPDSDCARFSPRGRVGSDWPSAETSAR